MLLGLKILQISARERRMLRRFQGGTAQRNAVREALRVRLQEDVTGPDQCTGETHEQNEPEGRPADAGTTVHMRPDS